MLHTGHGSPAPQSHSSGHDRRVWFSHTKRLPRQIGQVAEILRPDICIRRRAISPCQADANRPLAVRAAYGCFSVDSPLGGPCVVRHLASLFGPRTAGSPFLSLATSRADQRTEPLRWNIQPNRTLRGMEPVTPAILLLLTCAPASQHCREMRHNELYVSVEACRAALPAALRRLSTSGRHAIGRCVSDHNALIDPVTTGSVGDRQYAIVRVTRIAEGREVVSVYRVPRTKR